MQTLRLRRARHGSLPLVAIKGDAAGYRASLRLSDAVTPSRLSSATIVLVAVAAALTAVTALVVPSLADTDRMIPISVESVLQAAPLMLIAYLVGLGVTLAVFDVPQRASLFSMAFLLRIVVMLFISVLFQQDDEIRFFRAALRHSHGLWSWTPGDGYYHLNEIAYAAFGPNLLLPKTVNVLLGSLVPFLAYDIALQLFRDRSVANRAWWWTAVLPPTVIYSTLNVKEIASCFLCAAILWCLCRLSRWPARWVGVTACSAALYWLRDAPWVLAASAGSVAYVILGAGSFRRTMLTWPFWTKLVAAVALIAVLSPMVIRPVSTTLNSRLTQEEAYRTKFKVSSATVMKFVDRSNPLSAANSLVFFVRGLYSPSPLRLLVELDVGTIIQVSNMLVWYVLFPFAVIGVIARFHQGSVLACAAMVLAVLIMATVGMPVGGDPERHRFVISAPLFVLAAAGVTIGPSSMTRWVLSSWWLGAVIFNAAWFHMLA
jgi:hypothetical protein